MRTLKEHILEKLKVTSKVDNYMKPTYQEYYDLLYRYCKTNNEKFLDLNRVYDYDDNQFPSLEVAKYMIIITIRPTVQNDPKIILKTYDCMKQNTSNTSYVNINVTAEADNEVSFMSDDAIEKTVKYMEENIK